MGRKEDGQNMRMIGVLFTIGVLSGAMAIWAQGEQYRIFRRVLTTGQLGPEFRAVILT